MFSIMFSGKDVVKTWRYFLDKKIFQKEEKMLEQHQFFSQFKL